MNKRLVTVFLMAVVIAGAFTLIFAWMFGRGATSEQKPVPTVRVLVASRDLPGGTLIRDTDLGEIPWATDIPPNAVTKKDLAVGRGVVTTIYKGEPIFESRLAPKGAGAGLAATIPPGYRAVAVRVNDIVGVAGFVVPGQHVDILIAGMPPGTPATVGTLSRTLLQNVEVLSAGQNTEKDPEGKPINVSVVNLLVTPTDAEVLSLASTETRLQLVLRNPVDVEKAKTPGTAVASLFSGQKYSVPGSAAAPAPVRRAAPRPPVVMTPVKEAPPVVVEVIQGTSRNSVKFTEESR